LNIPARTEVPAASPQTVTWMITTAQRTTFVSSCTSRTSVISHS